jgi:hypothetical protein
MRWILPAAVLGIMLGVIVAQPSIGMPSAAAAQPGRDHGGWGTISVDTVRRVAQLRTLRVETSTLQWVCRKEPMPLTWGTMYNWRNLAAVVPVSCELGIPLEAIDVQRIGLDWHVTLPRASVLRATPIYAGDKMLIWKNEGNAFNEQDLLPLAVRNGEAVSIAKCAQLGTIDRATDACVEAIRAISAVLGIPPERLHIEIRPDTAAPRDITTETPRLGESPRSQPASRPAVLGSPADLPVDRSRRVGRPWPAWITECVPHGVAARRTGR